MFGRPQQKEPSERWNQRSKGSPRWIILAICLVGAILAYLLTKMMLKG